MTAKKTFCFYIILSAIAAQYFTSDNSEGTLFGYGTLVDQNSLFKATEFLAAGLAVFLIASYASKPFFATANDLGYGEDVSTVRVMPRSSLPTWQIVSLVIIVAIYILQFVTTVLKSGLPQDLSERIFENKFSAFLMVTLAYLGYSYSLRKDTLISRLAILVISLSVVIIDRSRSGLIPMLGLFFGALSRKKFISVLFLGYLFFFEMNFAIGSRQLGDGLGLDLIYSYLFPDLDLVIEAVRFTFDYLFAFSVLNFSYMAFVAQPEYTWAQLLTSINPLPSYFMDPDALDLLKFEDHARAIGGPAELLSVGSIAFFLGFFLIGVLAAYADTIIKSRFRFIVLLMFLLASVIFFEYSLRMSARIFSAIFVVIFLLKRSLKSTRQVQYNSNAQGRVIV